MRGSRGYAEAARFVAEELRDTGSRTSRSSRSPPTATMFYGTQRSRPAWDAEFAELWELQADETWRTGCARRASWEAMPLSLAQDSESGDVDRGCWSTSARARAAADYAGKDVRGKLVLTSSQPEACRRSPSSASAPPASSATRRTSGRRGGAKTRTWCAGAPRQLRADADLRLHGLAEAGARVAGAAGARRDGAAARASCEAGQHAGAYDIVTARSPAADPRRRTRRSSSAATWTIRARAPTTTPAAARPSWRSRARSPS